MTTRVSAANPIDFVSVAGSVQFTKFNRRMKVTIIDFEGLLRICLGWRRQLIKPSELVVAFILSPGLM